MIKNQYKTSYYTFQKKKKTFFPLSHLHILLLCTVLDFTFKSWIANNSFTVERVDLSKQFISVAILETILEMAPFLEEHNFTFKY